MKKLKMSDGSIVLDEIGFDNVNNKWAIPENVQSVEFEDGTILENPDFVSPEE